MKVFNISVLIAGAVQEVQIIASNEHEAKSILRSVSDATIITE